MSRARTKQAPREISWVVEQKSRRELLHSSICEVLVNLNGRTCLLNFLYRRLETDEHLVVLTIEVNDIKPPLLNKLR